MRKNFRQVLTVVPLLALSVTGSQTVAAAGSRGAASSAASAQVSVPPSVAAPNEVRTITGTVVDVNDNEPLVGASILLKGSTSTGTSTDVDGRFTLTLSAKQKKAVLVVSYVGYKTKEVPVEDLSTVRIGLSPSSKSLDEVVVTAAGTQKKVSVTGAIASVEGERLEMSSTALTLNLAGKFAGVYANNVSGAPTEGSEFYIRGISNFAGKNATPLILLDDVEISAGDLNNIPPENIKSFSVLKDASATAIYGARGANGVMIVTTKNGDYNSQAKINVSVENTFNFMGEMPKFVDGATYMEMFNKAQYWRNPLENPLYSEETIERTRSGANPYLYPDTDWQDVLFKKMATRQRGNINVTGGGSKVRYYMSLNMQHETGHYKTKKLYSWDNQMRVYRYDFQNNISYKLTPSTTISMNMNAQIGQNVTPNVGADSFFNYVLETNPILMTPTYPARDGYDHVLYGTYARGGNQFVTNPYSQLQTSYWQYNYNLVNTVVKVDQDLDVITKGLKFNMWVNFKGFATTTFTRGITPYLYTPLTRDVEDWQNPVFDLSLAGNEGSKYISQSGISRYADNTFELQGNINWNRNFNGHELSALVLYRMREFRNNVLPNRNQGFSGRATYDYMHRYLAEFNFGYNGTERLAKGYRFGFFPAASLGWVVSNEDFWEPLNTTVSHFKIRGSYGLVGSDDLTPPGSSYYFFYYDQIANNNLSQLQWTSGAGGTLGGGDTGGGPQMSYYALPTLGWEKVKKLDIGVDFRLFNDLNVTLDYFHDRRYDILLRRSSWPASLGYAHAIPYGPVGKVENKGVEGSVTYSKSLTPDLAVSFNGNFTYNRNTLVYSDELNYKYPWLFSTGLPVNHTRGYIAEGLFRSQEEIDNSPVQNLGSNVMVGDIKYRDLNGDGQINSDDQTMISPYGNRPRLQYGFGATVNYKKFDFGFFFTGSAKVKKLINGMDPFRRSVGQEPRNMLQYVFENYFDPEKQNFDAEYPLMGVNLGEIQNNTVNSTFWLRDASFLRLRNLEAGYTFPFGRFYVQGNNLLNITSFKYWDPEMASWNKYPTQHSVTVGIQFNL